MNIDVCILNWKVFYTYLNGELFAYLEYWDGCVDDLHGRKWKTRISVLSLLYREGIHRTPFRGSFNETSNVLQIVFQMASGIKYICISRSPHSKIKIANSNKIRRKKRRKNTSIENSFPPLAFVAFRSELGVFSFSHRSDLSGVAVKNPNTFS